MKKICIFLSSLLSFIFLFTFFACHKKNKDDYKVVTINGLTYHLDEKTDEPFYYLYKANDKNITEITIPDYINDYPVKMISRDLGGWLNFPFEDCKKLEKVELPYTITVIGYGAFENCTSLKSINIPNSVETIFYSAFDGCSSLTSITIPNKVKEIYMHTFKDCTSLKNISLPYQLKKIGDSVFENCSSLTEINLPSGIKTIGEKAFMNCSSLKKINLPNSITSIGRLAFWGCVELESMRIPNQITTISEYMAFDCKKLSEIYIPKSVKVVEKSAFGFNSYKAIPNIYYEGKQSEWNTISIAEGNRHLQYSSYRFYESY